MMASITPSKHNCHITAYCVMRGVTDTSEISKSLMRIKERKLMQFVPWAPASFYVNSIRAAPRSPAEHISGLLLSNHTSVTGVQHRLFKRSFARFLSERASNTTDYGSETPFSKCIAEKQCFRRAWRSSICQGTADATIIFLLCIRRESTQKLIADYEMCDDPDYPSLVMRQ